MKSTGHLASILFALTGCTTYEFQPLGMNHPANPEAMTAPTQDAATDVVLARQPIFDADLRINAFELAYRVSNFPI